MSEQEMTIKEAAAKLGRSSSWVYTKLPELGEGGCHRERGKILINTLGFEKLIKLSAKSPGRGGPGVRRRAAMCADWCAEHGMGAPRKEK